MCYAHDRQNFRPIVILLTFIIICKIEGEIIRVPSPVYFFRINTPKHLAYSYEIQLSLSIGVDFRRQYQSVRLVYALPDNACTPLRNVHSVQQSVVLIERGDCSFLAKAIEAERAGALAVLITDSADATDTFIEMIVDDDRQHSAVSIPTAYLPGQSGRVLRQHLLYASRNEPILVTIPLNLTLTLLDQVRKPPWELW